MGQEWHDSIQANSGSGSGSLAASNCTGGIISLNLDDLRFSDLLDFRNLHDYVNSRTMEDKPTYVFIDEIQNCHDYEKAISSLFLKTNLDIYLTGSNAHILSGESATRLSGRYVKIDMLPLSFREYGEIVKITDKRERFLQFMNMGSFPYAAHIADDDMASGQYLEGVYNTVLVKDILDRKSISDATLLKSVANFLAHNVGSPVTANRIASTLAGKGRPTSPATIGTYLEALSDSYLFYKVDRYDIKGKAHLKTENKYYICDTGLRNMMLNAFNKDIGHQIENLVFLELLRRGYRVNVGRAGRGTEIDFLAVRNRGTEYYQVSASVLDHDVLERELAPLRTVKDNYPKFLLTLDDFFSDHDGIRQLNLIDWLTGAGTGQG
ncbi:MAG: ATP-binding protein [Deltaproteobacteria bacterium]|nr:ATP-binding protein [Deltaproteobacteria bacterium]